MVQVAETNRWEATIGGCREDGSSVTADVAVLQRRSKAGMPVCVLLSDGDPAQGDRLRVELHGTQADADPPPESGVDAMVMVSDESAVQLANAEAAILGDERGDGAPVDMLVADLYLDRHPGMRVGFFPESPTHPVADGPDCSGHIETSGADCYVHRLVDFHRCCNVMRLMGLLWRRSHPLELSHV